MSIYEHDGTARGMGPPSGMRWFENVVRDSRSASWKNHPSGRGNGEGSGDNVSPLSRHFSVPKLGDDITGPGVRSCGGRDDTGATLGGEKVNVHQIAGFHRESCISVYRQHGRINPRLWVESDDWFAIIDPTVIEALDVSDWDRTQMLMSAVRAVEGHVVGRCDEMLFRYGWNIGHPNANEPYEMLRETDPSIRSALVVHALDCRTTESYMTLATVDLDVEGMPFWERHDGQYSIPMMTSLWGVGRMLKEARKKETIPFGESERLCSDHGWLVTFLNKWEHGIS